MIIKKNDVALLMYYMLILVTIFSPERFGTTLKYAILPLVLMLLLYNVNPRITEIKILCFLFIVLIVFSSATADNFGIDNKSAVLRSQILLILFFALLSDISISRADLERLKSFYIKCACLCGIIILFRAVGKTVKRTEFTFVWGLKDINYILAFMLPAAFFSLRRLLFLKTEHKAINIICIGLTAISIVLLLTRAAFVTLLCVFALTFLEYLLNAKRSWKKTVTIIFVIVFTVAATMWIMTSPMVTRLTSASGYEENIRLIIWTNALKAFEARKIIGSGIGASSYYSYIAIGYQSHNNFIDIIGDYGILGGILFSLILISIANVHQKKRMYMLTYIVASLLPLAFINGLQTVVFWLPMILLAQESALLKKEFPNYVLKEGG